METKTIDAVGFRDGQRQQWNTAATGWRKWSELIDGAASGISERLVELAGVERGSRVLDVAAGYGEPTLSAARKAGPEGRVVATDISPEMLAFGRERVAAAGLDNIDFVESDAASLDFPEASFDAALSRWGIISSLMEKRLRRESERSSSRAPGWRSARGGRRSTCPS
ncbi:MAG: methyltransferase domain-containing protein [Actinobacteria bacterium]|nr:methyltransferase domain-containing protein [Actinomycetota bacterium]